MTFNIEYITDAKGKQKSVVIPQKQWDALLTDYEKLKKKVEVLGGIGSALKEVTLIKKGKLRKQTLSGFLNEQ
ncbi:MAG TPA: hypothetical protein VG603_14825 [Chitinophagales bacterium]|nr:hypothetical protein [Chitinophagales bacterium]